MRWWLAIASLVASSASSVMAEGLIVHLVDSHGSAVGDAVVTLISSEPTLAASSPAPAAVTRIIDQQDETFVPYVQMFRPGDKVVFRNSDTTRHHVYSFASIKKFDFVLSPGQSSPPMALNTPGVAAVGCNIHDHMITYLFVSAEPLMAVSDSGGNATFSHPAAGHYTARVWHPQLYPGLPQPSQAVSVNNGGAAQRLSFTLSLIPDPRLTLDRKQSNY
jgi:plastocyanin